MNILYTCDNNYVWLMGISMLSLFENNKIVENITVYLIGENISDDNKAILKQLAYDYQRKCIIIDMPELNIPESLITTRWPKSAFSRLYSAALLPQEVDKVLYLDCDTIIQKSLNELENYNCGTYPVCGIKDCISISYRKNIGLDRNSLYINAGVLLLNYTELRKMNVSEMIDDFLANYSKTIHYADQDVLNGMFKGRFGILPAEYDVMTLVYMHSYEDILKLRHPVNYYAQGEIEKAVENAKIIHFTTNMLNVRPWFSNTNHPMAKEFIKYKDISPWKSRELTEMPIKYGRKEKILKLLHVLPHGIEMAVLGFVHATAYPLAIRWMKNY